MSIIKVYIGSTGPFLYDDSKLINDGDGDFAGQNRAGLTTGGDIVCDIAHVTALSLISNSVAVDYLSTDDDYMIYVDCSGGDITLTLPTVVGRDGRLFAVSKKDETDNIIRVEPESGETISYETYQEISFRGDTMVIIAEEDDLNWTIT